jgi:methylglyoxal synthase
MTPKTTTPPAATPGTPTTRARMPAAKNIVLIAHDSRKQDLLEWVKYNRAVLQEHRLFATGTTGGLVQAATDLPVVRFKSGPLGGDQQVGAKIAEGELDVMIFFWDPLEPQPHDPDVKALLRIAVLYNIPTACNRATADFIVASSLFHDEYDRLLEDHAAPREAWVEAQARAALEPA